MASPQEAARVISLIDLTDLNDDHDPDGLDALVARAVEHGVPAVCIWPEFVDTVSAALGDGAARCGIATVVNFPSGSEPIDDVVELTIGSLAAGADEIDLVLPYHELLQGDVGAARSMVEAVVDTVHERTGGRGQRGIVKVILETGELVEEAMIASAGRLAVDAGADYLKSSTGKTAVSATLPAFSTMIDVVASADRTVGLKPSGGIRTVDEAIEYLRLVDSRLGPDWATPATFRFGASSLLDDAVAVASSH
jgi:deoxyribose-phosphate aldolase